MYANYFGFRDVPFRQLSDPRHVYMSAEFEAAREELLEALGEEARVVLLMGHAGTGKTKLLRHLHAYLEPSRPIFYLPFSPLQVETFIEQTAVELDIELDQHIDLFQAFQDGLRSCASAHHRPVLLIDDAHNLGCDVLENLIDLFQLAGGQEPLAQLVLVAHPEIEYTLQRPELSELEANMARLSRLQPLAAEDVGPYIIFALRSIGYEGEPVFTQEAIRRVAAQTRGVPQLINTLCEASFLVAYGQDQNPVTPDIIDTAVEEVAGFAMGEPHDLDVDDIGEEVEWVVDDEIATTRKMPGVIQAWLKRSQRWPIAAVGIGGTVAVTAIVVLLVSVPFQDNAASARIRTENTVLIERMQTLRTEVATAHEQRDDLAQQLEHQVDERDRLREQLADLHMTTAIPQQTRVTQPVPASSNLEAEPPVVSKAEQLLAELMRNAESEADTVALKYSAELTPQTAGTTHKVVPGDTLWNLSRRYGLDVSQLMQMNDLESGEKIVIGQLLNVRDAKPESIIVAASSGVQPDWYTVKPGDSLYGIGRQFDSSVDDLKGWNQLSDANQLSVGQRLRVADE